MENFSKEAEDTWSSFLEMNNSKASHLEKLLAISGMKDENKYPSLQEERELGIRLKRHDVNVKEFAKKIRALKQISTENHEIIIRKMIAYSQENLPP
jgi:hypothetical protein